MEGGVALRLCDVGLMVSYNDNETVGGGLRPQVVGQDAPVVLDAPTETLILRQRVCLCPRSGGVWSLCSVIGREGRGLKIIRSLQERRGRGGLWSVRRDGLEKQEERARSRHHKLLMGDGQAVLVRYDTPSVIGPAVLEVLKVEGPVEPV